MTIKEFRLPDPGEGLVEADIVTWHVKVGDTVAVNDIVLEVETSKSLVELPIPFEGTVSELLVSEGDTVDVGAPIIRVDDGVAEPAGQASGDLVPELPPATPAGSAPAVSGGERVANLVGYGPKSSESKRRPRKAAAGADPISAEAHAQVAERSFATDVPVSRRPDQPEALPPVQAESVGGPLPTPGVVERTRPVGGAAVLAKPPVRKLARDLGVDLESVPGSGPGGVITREDVEQASAATSTGSSAGSSAGSTVSARDTAIAAEETVRSADRPTAGDAGETRIPIKGVRKATAKAMVQSAFTAPHVSEWVTLDVSATMELVERLKARREFRDVKITPMLIIAKAVCLALQRTPALHSTWDEAAQEIVIKNSINLGIAAATPRGLVVPNIKGAEAYDLRGLAAAFAELVSTARAGKTQPADMTGGTFTITNVGVFGVDGGTPILNPGEAGILCVGQIVRRPWVVGTGDEEQIVPRWVTTIGVSFDHRLADGEQGSTFLADVAGILADPGLALLF